MLINNMNVRQTPKILLKTMTLCGEPFFSPEVRRSSFIIHNVIKYGCQNSVFPMIEGLLIHAGTNVKTIVGLIEI